MKRMKGIKTLLIPFILFIPVKSFLKTKEDTEKKLFFSVSSVPPWLSFS
jgi:hypothetical protein